MSSGVAAGLTSAAPPRAGTVTAMSAPTASGPARGPLAEPSRITFAGDFHTQAGWAKWVLRAAKRDGADVLIPLGDLGVWPDPYGQRFLDLLSEHAQDVGIPVLFTEGNHEDFDFLEQFPIGADGLRQLRPWVWHLPRGFRWTWGGLTFAALGGATCLNRPDLTPGFDWFPAEEITWAQAENMIAGGSVDVLVTHDCPAGVDIPDLPPPSQWAPEELRRAQNHRDLLRAVVDQIRPTHLFHGHYHVRYDAELDLGGLQTAVCGLDRDQSMSRGYRTYDLDALYLDSAIRRGA